MAHIHKRAGKPVPEMIENLAEHKRRVKYSPTNELVLNQNKTYPKTRWYTVISVPDDTPHQMKAQLKKLSNLFQNCFSERLKISPGRRFMDYVLNSGQDRILNGLKSYLGNDENNIMSTVNKQLLDLGKKEHVYHFEETMNRNMGDFDIKKVLTDFLMLRLGKMYLNM